MPNRPPRVPAALRAAALLVVLLLVTTACGSDGGNELADDQAGADQGTGEDEGGSGVQVSGAADAKPQITIPDGEPPAELEVRDLIEGDGPEAGPRAFVTAHYVGVSWSDGTQFDASWDRGEPTTFPLDQVITGWSEGIPGMKVGGRRLLVIPPGMAYGDMPPAGSGIASGETLVFVVDLVDVQDAQ